MALNIQGTREAAKAWTPDKVAFKAEEVIPDALLLKASTIVDRTLCGDNTSVLVPGVNNAATNWTYEHEKIETTSVDLSQVAIHVPRSFRLSLSLMSYGPRKLSTLMLFPTRPCALSPTKQTKRSLAPRPQSRTRSLVSPLHRALSPAAPSLKALTLWPMQWHRSKHTYRYSC